MAYTSADLAKDALIHIGVLATAQEPSAEDDALMQRIITGAQMELVNISVAYWDLTDIPKEIQNSYKEWVGAKAGPSFQVAVSPSEEVALLKIRRMSAVRSHNEPIPAEYF